MPHGGRGFCPGGTFENSPAFQRRVRTREFLEDAIQNTYSMGQSEADVILHERPVLPARFNPKTTRLEVLTEFVEAPAAKTTKMDLKKESDTAQDPKLLLPFQDEAIDFGAMLMGPGRAFKRVEGEAQGEDSGSASALPVAKDWRPVEGGATF